jgi:hypothetical protein
MPMLSRKLAPAVLSVLHFLDEVWYERTPQSSMQLHLILI